MMKIKPQTEKEITQSIRGLLKVYNIFHWKVWQGLGSKRGVSDIIGIHKGKFIAIEVKRKDASRCPYKCNHNVCVEQRAFLNHVNTEGGIGFVARSIDDVVDRLDLGEKIFKKVNK